MLKCTSKIPGNHPKNGEKTCPACSQKSRTARKQKLQLRNSILKTQQDEIWEERKRILRDKNLIEAEELLLITPEEFTSEDAEKMRETYDQLYNYATKYKDHHRAKDYNEISDEERDLVDDLEAEAKTIRAFQHEGDVKWQHGKEEALYLADKQDYENNGQILKEKTEKYLSEIIEVFNKYPNEGDWRGVEYLEPTLSEHGSYRIHIEKDESGVFSPKSPAAISRTWGSETNTTVAELPEKLYETHRYSHDQEW